MTNPVHGYNSRTAEKFVVRLPEGMRAVVATAADDNKRSSNAEFIWRMYHSLLADGYYESDEQAIPELEMLTLPATTQWIPQVGQLVVSEADSSHIGVIDGFSHRKGVTYAKVVPCSYNDAGFATVKGEWLAEILPHRQIKPLIA